MNEYASNGTYYFKTGAIMKKYFKKVWHEKPHPEYKELLSSLALYLKMNFSRVSICFSNSIYIVSKILLFAISSFIFSLSKDSTQF